MPDTIRALIVEDDQENIFLLENLLQIHCEHVKITESAQTVAKAYEILLRDEPELLLLDIELAGGETGFDLLRKIETWETKPYVVFITAYDHYALQAFKFHAFDYILKPVLIRELKETLSRLSQEIMRANRKNYTPLLNDVSPDYETEEFGEFLVVSHLNKIQLIRRNEIVYLEASGKYTYIHTIDGSKTITSKNIGQYEEVLKPNFFRVHHSFVINIDFVKSLDKTNGWMSFY